MNTDNKIFVDLEFSKHKAKKKVQCKKKYGILEIFKQKAKLN